MKVSQALVIILLVANLIATVWFGVKSTSNNENMQAKNTSQHTLPKIITSEIKNELFDQFTLAFNSGDYKSMYNLMGPIARAQYPYEKAEEDFPKLIKFFHSVESGTFTYSELVKSQGDTNIYNLNYTVVLSEKSELGRNGNLRITILIQGDDHQVYGFHLNAGDK